MRGAMIFVIAFAIFLAATFAYPELPSGNVITRAMDIDPKMEWSGLAVKTLVSAILNGVIYGVIIWLIFTMAEKARQ